MGQSMKQRTPCRKTWMRKWRGLCVWFGTMEMLKYKVYQSENEVHTTFVIWMKSWINWFRILYAMRCQLPYPTDLEIWEIKVYSWVVIGNYPLQPTVKCLKWNLDKCIINIYASLNDNEIRCIFKKLIVRKKIAFSYIFRKSIWYVYSSREVVDYCKHHWEWDGGESISASFEMVQRTFDQLV